ncbi:MAG: ABC transporter permease, partial [Chloroflexi bacterium]|nr:ABC transporter permease [Chloroflexota bacterium]
MASAESAVLTQRPPTPPALARAPTSLWRDAWRRMLRNKPAVVSMIYIALLALSALFANVIAPYSFEAQDLDHPDEAPTALHIFGTDNLGRDLFSRMLYGSRISLAVAVIDILIVLLIGVPLGMMAGFFGRWADALVMRSVDVLYAFPNLLLIIIVITSLRAVLDQPQQGVIAAIGGVDKLTGGLLGVFIALAVVSWLTVARLVRGQVLSLKEKEYVEAARTVGARNYRIMFSHLLPNVMAPIIVSATFGIPQAIANEAGLSFLGLGVRP